MCPTLIARSGISTGSHALLLPLEPVLHYRIPPAVLEPVRSHLQSEVASEGKGGGSALEVTVQNKCKWCHQEVEGML